MHLGDEDGADVVGGDGADVGDGAAEEGRVVQKARHALEEVLEGPVVAPGQQVGDRVHDGQHDQRAPLVCSLITIYLFLQRHDLPPPPP